LGRLGVPISKLLPDIFKVPRLATDPSSPLIYSGSLLQMSDITMLPVHKKEVKREGEKGVKLYGAFGSYAVIQSLVVLPPENSYKFLWRPTSELLIWVGSVSSADDLDTLLSVFESTAFGAARLSGKQIRTLVTLDDVVGLVREGTLVSQLCMDDISSELITTAEDNTMVEALHLMFKARVRRLFLDDQPGKFVSDRSILALLFSPYMLKVARDSPEKWLEASVRELPKREASSVLATDSLMEGTRPLGHWPDDCLLTDNNRVVTRWDIVMKSWKRDLELAPAIKVEPNLRNGVIPRERGSP
jgi:hypothetical protein